METPVLHSCTTDLLSHVNQTDLFLCIFWGPRYFIPMFVSCEYLPLCACQAGSGRQLAPCACLPTTKTRGEQRRRRLRSSVVAQQLQRQHLHGHGVSLRPLYQQADQEGPVRHVHSVRSVWIVSRTVKIETGKVFTCFETGKVPLQVLILQRIESVSVQQVGEVSRPLYCRPEYYRKYHRIKKVGCCELILQIESF